MPFDEYMEWCLYDPEEGFFSAGPIRSGKKGDFVTSPEISWSFGVPVGEWAEKSMPSDHAALIEVGAGSGALLSQVADIWTTLRNPVYAVERSVRARARIAAVVEDVQVVSELGEVPRGIDAVIIANEVLDNIPAALARRVNVGWVEVAVDAEGENLELVDIPARADVLMWCDDTFSDVPDGTVVSVQLGVAAWIDAVFEHFGEVSLCLIDYGGTSRDLAGRDPASVVRSYRAHQSGLDWLQHPGETDITVDLNVDAVVRAIKRSGHEARVTSQRKFCLEYGLGDVIADAVEREQMAAAGGQIMRQLENRSERLDLEALIDPDGLGAFRVILATTA